MTRHPVRRAAILVAAVGTALLAACANPTAPNDQADRSGVYGGSGTKACSGVYGGSGTCTG